MDTLPGIDAARRATVQVYDRGAEPGKAHRGQGLLLNLDDQLTVVLTCHHVIAPVAEENLSVRIREAKNQYSRSIPVRYDAQRSQTGKDAVVLLIDPASVSPRPRPLLHALNPDTYAGSRLATGLTYMEPESFLAFVRAVTRLDIPVSIRGSWPDPPTRYILPVVYPLGDSTDTREGISGGVVLCEDGVLGLVHFSRRATPDQQREAYLVPLTVWGERLPELTRFIETLIDAELRVNLVKEKNEARREMREEIRQYELFQSLGISSAKKNQVINRMRALAPFAYYSWEEIALYLCSLSDGERIAALASVQWQWPNKKVHEETKFSLLKGAREIPPPPEHPDTGYFPQLLEMLCKSYNEFENYHATVATWSMLPSLKPMQIQKLYERIIKKAGCEECPLAHHCEDKHWIPFRNEVEARYQSLRQENK